jgi:hypothetical protein
MGSWLWPWEKNVITTRGAIITFNEESAASPVKNQGNADHFFWCGGSGASLISFPTPEHESDCLQNCSAMHWNAVCLKRPHKWSSGTWLLHHNNAQWHMVLSVREFLAKHSMPVVPPQPLWPDLASCDVFLFLRLKSTLKGKQFQDIMEIQLDMTW